MKDMLTMLRQHLAKGPQIEKLGEQLEEAGFNPAQISQAMSWFDGLRETQQHLASSEMTQNPASRVFTSDELTKINTESRGLLINMEAAGILSPLTREVIIDRLMALNAPLVNLNQLKWVTLLTLLNQKDETVIQLCVEFFVLHESAGWLS